MRFLENGSDIPDELIRAVDEGTATFLCGAGVSMRVGLPSFMVLTEQIYARLGESWKNEPAECIAFEKEQYDRALRALEKRTHRPRTPSRVRNAVSGLLVAPACALPDHLALLQLSRDSDGRPKILTTNFDTLFERAAEAGTFLNVPSHAGKSVPKPGGEHDYGILHIHGRIADYVHDVSPSELVLTSADFGDAYLRDGWASQYIEDRMRLGTLVLVGYAADDAAMRLLLETLDADRNRFRDLKSIYAIEKGTSVSVSVWKSKGITPIEFKGFDEIYETLSEWARYSMDPAAYSSTRVGSILTATIGVAAMTENQTPQVARKKTPSDASEFEREQLRFFLSGDDVANKLMTINPSLAWLPVLHEMRLIQNGNQLVDWIERNFTDSNAIRDVVENLQFFSSETASFLESRLNGQAETLPPLLLKCWRLIIRNMKESKQGLLQNEWYEIAPQIKRGEHSADLLERVAETLRPKLKLSKRLSLFSDVRKLPEHPSDLMSVGYEVDDYLSADDVLQAWPEDATADNDSRLLSQITIALEVAIEDATEVGVEANEGYGTSDSDVPSVAQHDQNTYRSGFQVIVRVMAELWLRLAVKSPQLALSFVERWRNADFRLIRRIALFAATNPAVSAEIAANMLIELPSGELFLTGSSVESYRLIRMRWNDFTPKSKHAILRRLRQGPPREWFRVGAEIDRTIDRCRFDFLSEMVRDGFGIGVEAAKLLAEIAVRWPHWVLRPAEQAGFHSWHSSSSGPIGGNANKLADIDDEKLVGEAMKLAVEADFTEGDDWQALCSSDPDQALRGLDKASFADVWPLKLWRQFLWTNKEYGNPTTENRVAELLLQWRPENFSNISEAASWWLNQHSKALDDQLLWSLWDRIVGSSSIETEEVSHA